MNLSEEQLTLAFLEINNFDKKRLRLELHGKKLEGRPKRRFMNAIKEGIMLVGMSE